MTRRPKGGGEERSLHKGTVRALDRGLDILRLFTRERAQWTISELAEEARVPLASAYRLIATLERAGYLERTRPRGPLRLGLRLLYLGSVVQSGIDVREVVRPHMRSLATEAGDTTVLAIPGEHSVVCVEHVDGTYPIRPRSLAVGDHLPYHAGAISLVLLAHLSSDRLRALLEREIDAAKDWASVERIEARCAAIRTDGIAYSEGEIVSGTAALAVPLFGAGHRLDGALALTGIIDRFALSRRPHLESLLRRVGDVCSRQLGADY